MNGDDPEFLEAARLVREFFPESKAFVRDDVGLDWEALLGAMMVADYAADYSCYDFRNESDPDLGLAAMGGLRGPDDAVYARLLSHAALSPSGRAVVIPDGFGLQGTSTEDCRPFVCDAKMVATRLREIGCFGQSRDTIIVFESGEAILVDHDNRVHWSRSKENHAWRGRS